MLANPSVRLVLRALVAAVGAFAVQLQGHTTWDGDLLRSAAVGAVLAALEYFTSLNPTVGK